MEKQLTTEGKIKFSTALKSDVYQNLIKQTLGDQERAKRFVSAISSAVAVNKNLQECTPASILSGALLGESLNLSPSPQLGHYYLVPYNDTKKGVKTAQFQLGYKGYIQLAMRSGYYKDIDVIEVREGEYLGRDKETGRHKFEFIENDEIRENKPVVGYMSSFEYLNGFTKVLYWSKEKMLKHADNFSSAFNREIYNKIQEGKIAAKDMWKYSSFWYKDFDSMAFKTMIRQLLSKWGIMSIEMQEAYTKDMASINTDGSYEYVDNENNSNEETSNTIIEQDEKTEEDIDEAEIIDNTEILFPESVEEQVDLNEL